MSAVTPTPASNAWAAASRSACSDRVGQLLGDRDGAGERLARGVRRRGGQPRRQHEVARGRSAARMPPRWSCRAPRRARTPSRTRRWRHPPSPAARSRGSARSRPSRPRRCRRRASTKATISSGERPGARGDGDEQVARRPRSASATGTTMRGATRFAIGTTPRPATIIATSPGTSARPASTGESPTISCRCCATK